MIVLSKPSPSPILRKKYKGEGGIRQGDNRETDCCNIHRGRSLCLEFKPNSILALSLRQVEDLLSERGIDICHETVRYWWNRFGPLFAGEIRRRRVHRHWYSNWRWHLDEVFVRINGKTCYLWRAVDHEGEVLEVLAQKVRSKAKVDV